MSAPERFTVFGAGGYIGARLVAALEGRGAEVLALRRGDAWSGRELGHVIYAVAVTNDAHERPAEALFANAGLVLTLLGSARFASLLYLSTAQVYAGGDRTDEEAPVLLAPGDRREIYRATKVLGEMACLSSPREGVRVARLAAVYGGRLSPRSFLAGVVGEAVTRGRIELQTTLDSVRDFVHIDDVTRALVDIASRGRQRLYNVASGRNVTNAAIVEALARETGCAVIVSPTAVKSAPLPIDVSRLRGEFGHARSEGVLARMGEIVAGCRGAAGGGRS